MYIISRIMIHSYIIIVAFTDIVFSRCSSSKPTNIFHPSCSLSYTSPAIPTSVVSITPKSNTYFCPLLLFPFHIALILFHRTYPPSECHLLCSFIFILLPSRIPFQIHSKLFIVFLCIPKWAVYLISPSIPSFVKLYLFLIICCIHLFDYLIHKDITSLR